MPIDSDYILYLVDNAKKGRKNSYEELYSFFSDEIYRLIYHIVPNEELTNQITADTFLSIWRNISELEDNAYFIEWLKETAIFLAFQQFKKVEEEIEVPDNLKDFESLFLSLPVKSRIAILLKISLDFDIKKIKTALNIEEHEEIKIILLDPLRKILHFNMYDNLNSLSDLDLVNVFFNPIDEQINETIKKEISSFQEYFKSIFANLHLPFSVLDVIKSELFQQSLENKSREKNLDRFKRQALMKDASFNDQSIKNTAKTKEFTIDDEKLKELIGKKENKNSIKSKVIVPIIVAIIIGIAGYYFLYFSKINTPWLIVSHQGKYTINNKIQIDKLYENERLTTYDNSTVKLVIPEVAKLLIKQNTSLSLAKAFDENNIIKLFGGSLNIYTNEKFVDIESFSDIPRIVVNNDYFTAKLETCNLSITQNMAKEFKLELSQGWAEIESSGNSFYLSPDYYAIVSEFINDPIPIRNGAHNSFYANLVLSDDALQNESSLIFLLNNAEENDLLTLYHLLKLRNGINKKLVLEKIKYFIPFIDEQASEGILNQNEDDMLFLLETIKMILPSLQ